MSSKQNLPFPFPFPPGIHYNGKYYGCLLVSTLQCGNPDCACTTGCQRLDCRTCTLGTTFHPVTPPQRKEKRKAISQPSDDDHCFYHDEGMRQSLSVSSSSSPLPQRSLGTGGRNPESPSSSRSTSTRESPSPPRSRGFKSSPLRQGR